MKKLFALLLTAACAVSCDDGDIIVTDFEFEDQNLQWCGDEDNQVFFKINNNNVHEAIALTLDFTRAGENLLFEEEILEGESFPINETNQVIYRTFSEEVEASYFCNQIPPVSPTVQEEYRSTSGGEIIITSVLNNAEDHDNDGVPSSIEMEVDAANLVDGYPDTDGDGIPNYLDIDDDNDNVLTSVEIDEENIVAEQTADGYPDTDGDGIPNYLDADDDNDGVISREEDWNESRDPSDDVNDEGVPHYLNPDIDDRIAFDSLRDPTFRRSFSYTIQIQNLSLVRQGGDGEQIRMGNYTLGTFNSPERAYNPAEELDEDEEENGGEDESED